MKIFVSVTSLKQTLEEQAIPLIQTPTFVRPYGFEGLELSDRELEGYSQDDLLRLRERCEEAQCGVIFDINADLTDTDDTRWQQEIQHVQQMLAIASLLQSRSARICLGGQTLSIQKLLKQRSTSPSRSPRQSGWLRTLLLNPGTLRVARTLREQLPSWTYQAEAKLQRAIQALQAIIPVAIRYQIPLGIENHWGISTEPANITRVVQAVGSPWLGTCPDFGNFPRGSDRYDGLALLAPYALHVQAKSWRFTAEGEETTINYQRALQIFRDSGYSGTITVEFEGGGDELEGCLRTRDLILRHW